MLRKIILKNWISFVFIILSTFGLPFLSTLIINIPTNITLIIGVFGYMFSVIVPVLLGISLYLKIKKDIEIWKEMRNIAGDDSF